MREKITYEDKIINKAMDITRMRALGFKTEDELKVYDADKKAQELFERARQAKTEAAVKAYELKLKPYLDSIEKSAEQTKELAEKEISDAIKPFLDHIRDAIKPIAKKYNVGVEFTCEGAWKEWKDIDDSEAIWFDVGCRCNTDLRAMAISMMKKDVSGDDDYAQEIGARPY